MNTRQKIEDKAKIKMTDWEYDIFQAVRDIEEASAQRNPQHHEASKCENGGEI